MAELEDGSAVSGLGKCGGIRLCAPVGIHDEPAHANADQMIERVRDQRFVGDGDERLGALLRQRLEPGAQPCPEDERGSDHDEGAAVVYWNAMTLPRGLRGKPPPNCALPSDKPDAISSRW